MPDNELYTDKELFIRISEGSEQAFGLLFHQYAPRLVPLALKITKDREIAKEIVQETFLRVWLRRDQLGAIENPSAWIFTIASNQCYKYLRRKVLANNLSLETFHEDDPDDVIGLRELSVLVNKAVDQLSEQRKKVYLLSREGGLTIPEIAAELDLSPNTVKNTLVSALKFIREYLESQGYLLPALLISWIA